MKHRHLQSLVGRDPDALPAVAILDLLARGDLNDWRPLVGRIAAEPLGPLATRVAHLIDAYPSYGVSPLFRAYLERCRARAQGGEDPRRQPGEPLSGGAPIGLAALRQEQGLTQVELAARIGISQSDLSKLERRRDVRVSTLRALARALNGHLRIVFTLPARTVEVKLG